MTARHRAPGHSRQTAAVAFGLMLTLGVITAAVTHTSAQTRADVTPTASSVDPAPPSAAVSPAHSTPAQSAEHRQPRELAPQREVAADDDVEVAPPTTVSIDRIGVESALQPLGLNDDGSLEVPAVGPLYDRAAWFTGSPRPGEVGPAVLLGHVNGSGGAPSVFFRLAELQAGHQVTVHREDGSRAHFEVYLVEQHPKDSFPTAAVYGDTRGPELRLITCAGTWDPGTGHYRDNTVVFARLVSGA